MECIWWSLDLLVFHHHRSIPDAGGGGADLRTAATGGTPRVLHGFQPHGQERGDKYQGTAGVCQSGRRTPGTR